MQTLLNAASMGLTIIEREAVAKPLASVNRLCSSPHEVDDSDCEIIQDVKSAISIATEICNDLLDYDKVRSSFTVCRFRRF